LDHPTKIERAIFRLAGKRRVVGILAPLNVALIEELVQIEIGLPPR
jgi:hypothetical protein